MAKSSVKGRDALKKRMSALGGKRLVTAVGKALFKAGEKIQTYAQVSITTGAVSGKRHVPSAPGEPPNNDTGVLAGNIETTQVAPLVVNVTSKAPYAAALEGGSERKAGTSSRSFRDRVGPRASKHGPVKVEFGDSRTPARPYMGPARDANIDNVNAMVKKAVDNVIKRAAR